MNTFIKLIGIGVLISIALGAWAVYELTSMKTEIASLNKDVTGVLKVVRQMKARPVHKAPPAQPEEPENVEVSIDDDPIKGDKDAPITIIEFSDFQCPYCKRFYDQVSSQIDEEYVSKGKVRMVFRDYPLPFHQKALPAAVAANCAGEQGKYWEAHDFFFENPDKLDTESFLGSAQELGLDKAKLEKCINETGKEQEAEINKDMEEGQKYGVRGTPSFFIGKTDDEGNMSGIYVRGAQPYNVFKQHIDELLEENN